MECRLLATMAAAVVAATVVALPSKADTPASERRVALVMGNAAYTEAPLKNPVNDARAMAKALQDVGFEVILRENTVYREMRRAVAEFGRRIAGGGVGIFYFAGHGMQVRGRNYLLPVDADIGAEAEVALETLDLNNVLEQMAVAGNRLNIAILDACRNNPFERRFRSTGGGLATVDAPKGTLIAFATAPGRVAADGSGDNGLYTSELLKAIRTPGLRVEDVLKRVRAEVARVSRDEQMPWESSSLTGDFYFLPPSANAASAGATTAAAPPHARPDDTTVELAFWSSIKESRDPKDFREYLGQFPQGRFAGLARNRLAALEPAPAATPGAPPTPEVEKLVATYRGVRSGNIRAQPNVQSVTLGRVIPDEPVAITGKVKGADWLQVALSDGRTAYVASMLVEPETAWRRRRETTGATASAPRDDRPATPATATQAAPKIETGKIEAGKVEAPKVDTAKVDAGAGREQAAAPRQGLAQFDGVYKGNTYTCLVGTPNPVEVTIANGVMNGIYERPLGPPRELTGSVDINGRVKGTGIEATFEGEIKDDKLTGTFNAFNIPLINQCHSSFQLTRK